MATTTKLQPLGNGMSVAAEYDENGKLIGSGGKAVAPLAGWQATGGNNTISRPSEDNSRKLIGAKKLADLYGGINFDEDSILRKFNEATRGQFAGLRADYANIEDQFYNKLETTGNMALDNIRKNNSMAIATGASKGMQAANELSAMLGLQQESSVTATELAKQTQQLDLKENAALADNSAKALETANGIKQALAGISANIYGQDTLFSSAELTAAAEMEKAKMMGVQAEATIEVQKLMNQYNLTRLEAEKLWKTMENDTLIRGQDKALEGTKYNADKNLESTKYSTDNYTPSGGYTGFGGNNPLGITDPIVQELMAKFGIPEDVAKALVVNEQIDGVYDTMYDAGWAAGDDNGAITALMKTYGISRDAATARLWQDNGFIKNYAKKTYGIAPTEFVDNIDKVDPRSLDSAGKVYWDINKRDLFVARPSGNDNLKLPWTPERMEWRSIKQGLGK